MLVAHQKYIGIRATQYAIMAFKQYFKSHFAKQINHYLRTRVDCRFKLLQIKKPADISAGFLLHSLAMDAKRKAFWGKLRLLCGLVFGLVDDRVAGAGKAQRKVGDVHLERLGAGCGGEPEEERIEFSVFDCVQLKKKLLQIR